MTTNSVITEAVMMKATAQERGYHNLTKATTNKQTNNLTFDCRKKSI
jgi:hypothetical protein